MPRVEYSGFGLVAMLNTTSLLPSESLQPTPLRGMTETGRKFCLVPIALPRNRSVPPNDLRAIEDSYLKIGKL